MVEGNFIFWNMVSIAMAINCDFILVIAKAQMLVLMDVCVSVCVCFCAFVWVGVCVCQCTQVKCVYTDTHTHTHTLTVHTVFICMHTHTHQIQYKNKQHWTCWLHFHIIQIHRVMLTFLWSRALSCYVNACQARSELVFSQPFTVPLFHNPDMHCSALDYKPEHWFWTCCSRTAVLGEGAHQNPGAGSESGQTPHWVWILQTPGEEQVVI